MVYSTEVILHRGTKHIPHHTRAEGVAKPSQPTLRSGGLKLDSEFRDVRWVTFKPIDPSLTFTPGAMWRS